MDTNNLDEAFEKIEEGIDALYDAAYGYLDAAFTRLDEWYQKVKQAAYEQAQRSGEGNMSPAEKASAIADWYENHGKQFLADLWRKQAETGLVDIKSVNKVWRDIVDKP